jgi:hypothetical protein
MNISCHSDSLKSCHSDAESGGGISRLGAGRIVTTILDLPSHRNYFGRQPAELIPYHGTPFQGVKKEPGQQDLGGPEFMLAAMQLKTRRRFIPSNRWQADLHAA